MWRSRRSSSDDDFGRGHSSETVAGLVHQNSAMSNGTWQENTPNCSLCGIAFVRVGLRMRHHCRCCQQCVCKDCAPTFVRIQGHRKPQRMCSECIAVLPRARELRTRLWTMGQRLNRVAEPRADTVSEPQSVEEALTLCENTVQPLCDSQARATAAISSIADSLLRTSFGADATFQHGGSTDTSTDPSTLVTRTHLEEAIANCESAAENADRMIIEERQKRLDAEERLASQTLAKRGVAALFGSRKPSRSASIVETASVVGPPKFGRPRGLTADFGTDDEEEQEEGWRCRLTNCFRKPQPPPMPYADVPKR